LVDKSAASLLVFLLYHVLIPHAAGQQTMENRFFLDLNIRHSIMANDVAFGDGQKRVFVLSLHLS
jgi:hypothetical protein